MIKTKRNEGTTKTPMVRRNKGVNRTTLKRRRDGASRTMANVCNGSSIGWNET